MAIDDKIRYEKLQYDIKREAAKVSPLSSGKIEKYEYLTGKEILPFDKRRVTEQAKFTYSPLGEKSKQKRLKIKVKSKQKHLKRLGNN